MFVNMKGLWRLVLGALSDSWLGGEVHERRSVVSTGG